MRQTKKLLSPTLLGAVALILAAPAGFAEERSSAEGSDQVVDLQLRQLPAPTTLNMRVATASAAAEEHSEAPDAEVSGEVSGEVRQEFSGTGYKPFPTSQRDLRERVLFLLNAGYGLDSGALSGDNIKSGFNPADVVDRDGEEFAENRNLVTGHMVLGSQGILLPTLNSYIQSRFSFDLFNGTSEFAGLTTGYDTQQLQLNAAYAELEGLTSSGPLKKIFLRAGRQYRYGAARYVTAFDGVTAAFDDPGLRISGFFGQRASIYFDNNEGIIGGAGLKLRGKDLFDLPVDLAVDYMFFDGGGANVEAAWAEIFQVDEVNVARQYIELHSRLVLGDNRITLRTRLVDNGDLRGEVVDDGNGNNVIEADGIGLGHIGVQYRRPFGQKLLLVAEVEQRFAREVTYDFVSPVDTDVIDVVDTSNLIGIGLEPNAASTLIGARVNAILNQAFEVFGFARVNIVPDNSQSGFNRPYQDLGAALSARVGQSLFTTAQFKLRLQQLDDDANGEGTDFFDTSGSGVTSFQEISGEVRYRMGGNARRTSAALGAYFRIYNLQTPYAEVEEDARAGARADFDFWLNNDIRFKAIGEFAQPSPTFAPELDTLVSVRVLTEALF